jgi:hypothetical protein
MREVNTCRRWLLRMRANQQVLEAFHGCAVAREGGVTRKLARHRLTWTAASKRRPAPATAPNRALAHLAVEPGGRRLISVQFFVT